MQGIPAAKYYKPIPGLSPALYVEYRGSWHCYSPDGTLVLQGSGPIPPGTLDFLEEIDEAEADLMLPAKLQLVEAGKGPRSLRLEDDAFARPAVVFSPQRRRWLAKQLIWPGLFLCAFAFVAIWRLATPEPENHTQPDWLFWALMGGILFNQTFDLFSRYRQDLPALTIRIGERAVEGPGWSWRGSPLPRELIALAELDRARSAKRGLIERLYGLRILVSANGKRIYLRSWAFTDAELRRLLDMLGVGEKASA